MKEYAGYTSSRGEMSLRSYNLTIGLVLLWGFAINAIMCKFCTPIFLEWNLTAVTVAAIVIPIIGIFVSRSESPLLSFIGYNMVLIPLGILLSLYLAEYEAFSVFNAMLVTAVVTFMMIVLAVVYPKVFLSMGKVLFFCLLGVVICEFIFILLNIVTPTLWDWLVVLIFCGYVGYDWAKAQEADHTLDNAIDAATELYLDIINIFIRVLSATGKRKD